MQREALKQELDKLNTEQLKQVADFVAFVQFQAQKQSTSTPFWKTATSEERVQELREWVSQLPQTNTSLPDTAFDRESIYE